MNKEKIDLLAKIAVEFGLTIEEVIAAWQKETYSPSKGWIAPPIINPNFGEDDIRSRVDIGWYAFAGGHFSPNKDAYPNCQGVIGIINDDPTAKEGNRVKVVLRHQKELKWCEKIIYTGVIDVNNGKENTRRLLEFGKKKGIKFPAMAFAQDYAFDGVKAGEAYVPARDELKELSKNFKVIDDALNQIGSSFDDWYWSSSELTNFFAWSVRSGGGNVNNTYKYASYAVSFLIDY